jgi:hypothetical protein
MRLSNAQQQQLSGILSWIFNPEEEAIKSALCPAAAYTQTVPIDNLAGNMQSAWNPTGYFSPDDVDAITGQQLNVMKTAWDALTQAYANVNKTDAPDAQSSLDDAQARLARVSSQTNDYIQAVKDARNQGLDAIYAPGMKDWALETLRATSWALQNSYNVICQVPSWIQILGAAVDACTAFSNIVLAIAGLVIQAGQAVYHAADKAFTFLGWVVKYAPFIIGAIVLSGIGFLAFKHRDKLKRLVHRTES